jgi:ribosomal protein S18 acetylase RimI-like enzyme
VGFIGAAGSTHEQVEDALAWASASISVELAPVQCQRWTRPLSPAHAIRAVPGGQEVLSLAGLPAADARQLAVSYVADIMFGELPRAEALSEAECTVAREYQRGALAGVYLPGQGLMLGFTDGGTGYVCCFGVLPEQRRSGAGSALMTAQLAAFSRCGATTAVSETDPRLPLGAALLRHCGFTPDPPGKAASSRIYSCGLDVTGHPAEGMEASGDGCTSASCSC